MTCGGLKDTLYLVHGEASVEMRVFVDTTFLEQVCEVELPPTPIHRFVVDCHHDQAVVLADQASSYP